MKSYLEKYKRETVLVIITAIVVFGFSSYYFRSQVVKISYPAIVKEHEKTYFGCTGLVLSSSYAEDGPAYKGREAIYGKVDTKNSLDKLAIEIKGDKLDLNTSFAIEYGNVKPETYQIIENSDERMTAIFSEKNPVGRISSFYLNKKTGLAVWNEVEQNFPSDSPEGHSEYFHCL